MVNALPYEIFLLITENLPMDRDVSLKADVNYHRCIYNGEAKPLTGGAKEGYVGITRLLLEHGAEVDLCNPDGGPCEPPSTLAAAEDKYGLLCYRKEIQNYRSSDDESLDESLYRDNIFDVRVTEVKGHPGLQGCCETTSRLWGQSQEHEEGLTIVCITFDGSC